VNKKYILECVESGLYKRTGNPKEVRINCPECGDSKYHLYININKGVFFCQRCHYSGSISKNINIGEKKIELPLNLERSLPEGSFHLNTGTSMIRYDALKYLLNRGITLRDINYYNIHYCVAGKYMRRVIFPIIERGKVIYFVARAIDKNAKKKVLNPRGNRELFNLEKASRYDRVVLVEGVFDAIKTGDNAIAVLGSHVSQYQIQKMKEYDVHYIDIMFDADKAGKEGALEVARELHKHFRDVRIVDIPFGDPDQLSLRNISHVDSWIKAKLPIRSYNVVTEYYNIYQKIKKEEL